MLKKLGAIPLFILLFTTTLDAQVSIYGVVANKEGQGLSYASIVLTQKNNGKVVAYTNTKENGYYTLSYTCLEDSLMVKVSCFDHSTYQASILNKELVIK